MKMQVIIKGSKNYKEVPRKLENSFPETKPELKAMNSRTNAEERISDLENKTD